MRPPNVLTALILASAPFTQSYQFYDCTPQQQNDLTNIIGLARASVGPALQELNNPRVYPPFEAFFGAKPNLGHLVEIFLQDIAAFSKIRFPKPRQSFFIRKEPSFICAKPTTRIPEGRWRITPAQMCHHMTREGMKDEIALSLTGWSYILICDRFWTLPAEPTEPRQRLCPGIVPGQNRFEPRGLTMVQHQTYMLAHELVHKYLRGNDLSMETTPLEVYTLWDCMALEVDDALRNPNNFMYFVAFAQCGCTVAPDKSQPPWTDESGGNLTALSEPPPLDSNPQNDNLSALPLDLAGTFDLESVAGPAIFNTTIDPVASE
ncbi:uncharacterized protein KY384_008632 [Bacidia gigantensis]|uniref:uncharacterized protein n=1 Tax=Bacidia gigantensis TaxID=2732470 RepID=UPI001D0475EF|nr:uncharacterized protein KY384_008632 [Bacidia gigantensis]KAG8527202.1 hypothetical protein KY384_008632 [Bacidia gigantensis]